MNEAVSARHGADAPLFGEAALRQAMVGLAASNAPGAPHGAPSARGRADAGKQGRAPAKTVAQVLGEVAWLMTQSPRHKQVALGDLEWLVMPALLLGQFRIFYQGEQPVGVALWALADDTVAKRIDGGDNRLTAVECKSGSNLRIIELVAPFGGENEMRNRLANSKAMVE